MIGSFCAGLLCDGSFCDGSFSDETLCRGTNLTLLCAILTTLE